MSAAPARLRQVFDEAVVAGAAPKSAAIWLTGEVMGWLRRADADPAAMRLDGSGLAELIAMIDEGTVSSSAAKEVLDGVMSGEGGPGEVAVARDLMQISDTAALERSVDEVIAANPDAVASYGAGEHKAIGFLVGQVMRATQGKADPKVVNQILGQKLSG